MVHLLIIKLNSNEIDGVPVTGTPVGSRTDLSEHRKLLGPPAGDFECRIERRFSFFKVTSA